MKITYQSNSSTNSALTKEINKYFKILFDYRIEEKYNISSINTVNHFRENRPFSKHEKAKLYKALCHFIDETTSMTYTDVEKKYGRKRDESDKTIDIEYNNEDFPVDHYSMARKGIGKMARIHGYIREGIFVVKRVDWGHNYHKKMKKKKRKS